MAGVVGSLPMNCCQCCATCVTMAMLHYISGKQGKPLRYSNNRFSVYFVSNAGLMVL